MKQHSLNQVFAFFLKHKGVTPKFRKTAFGYRTFNSMWKAFEDSMTITKLEPVKVYNGYDYDDSLEETKYRIVQDSMGHTDIHFIYKKII